MRIMSDAREPLVEEGDSVPAHTGESFNFSQELLLLSWSSCLEVLVAHLGGIAISQSVREVEESED